MSRQIIHHLVLLLLLTTMHLTGFPGATILGHRIISLGFESLELGVDSLVSDDIAEKIRLLKQQREVIIARNKLIERRNEMVCSQLQLEPVSLDLHDENIEGLELLMARGVKTLGPSRRKPNPRRKD